MISTEKARLAPDGGGGNGAARCTNFTAARSSSAEPELLLIDIAAKRPSEVSRKDTTAVPLAETRGRVPREILRMTCPG